MENIRGEQGRTGELVLEVRDELLVVLPPKLLDGLEDVTCGNSLVVSVCCDVVCTICGERRSQPSKVERGEGRGGEAHTAAR